MIPKLLEKLGVSYHKLYCEPNGIFPHNPEPLAENLSEISTQVVNNGSHLGLVVDPDVDRLAIVCEDGSMFGEEFSNYINGVSIDRYANDQITWEKATMTNLGFELGLFGKIDIQADYFTEYRLSLIHI